ncbi:MAG: DUF4286 family protein [Phaeodactylibacter sp.]|nr:DUF4286 family protein [Phaeodactylibacter sp.]MCB9295980.1 DUF4286 family protein [Lewinellaceae bacterium]
MILYNVTVKVDHDVHDDWLAWMKTVHIPDVLATGLFTGHKLCRLLGVDESDGITYAIQYFSPDMEAFQQYQQHHAPRLQKEHTERYEGRYVAFRTLMEVLAEGGS